MINLRPIELAAPAPSALSGACVMRRLRSRLSEWQRHQPVFCLPNPLSPGLTPLCALSTTAPAHVQVNPPLPCTYMHILRVIDCLCKGHMTRSSFVQQPMMKALRPTMVHTHFWFRGANSDNDSNNSDSCDNNSNNSDSDSNNSDTCDNNSNNSNNSKKR